MSRWFLVFVLAWSAIFGVASAMADASAEQNKYVRSPLELMAGKTAKVRMCGRDLDEAACQALVERVMSLKGVEIIAPIEIIPDPAHRRFPEIGGKCPPTGADIRGDAYAPFQTDMGYGRIGPLGPFKVFDISSLVPA